MSSKFVRLLPAAVVPALASTAVYFPLLLQDPVEWELNHSRGVQMLWLAALFLAAPTAAWVYNYVRPSARTWQQAAWIGLPQVPLAVGLLLLDVKLDDMGGYYVGYELGMAYVVGTTAAVIVGLFVAGQVVVAAKVGTSASRTKVLPPS